MSRLEKFREARNRAEAALRDANMFITFSETSDREAGDILYEGSLLKLKLAVEEMESLCAH